MAEETWIEVAPGTKVNATGLMNEVTMIAQTAYKLGQADPLDAPAPPATNQPDIPDHD